MTKYFLAIIFIVLLMNCNGKNGEEQYVGVIEGDEILLPALNGGVVEEIFIQEGEKADSGELLVLIDTADFQFLREKLLCQLKDFEIQKRIIKNQIDKSSNQLDLIKLNYDRYSELNKNETISESSYDEIKTRLRDGQFSHAIITENYNSILVKEKMIKIELEQLEKKIKDCRIEASLNGIVTDLYYERKEGIAPMNPVLKMIDLSRVWVKIYVPEPVLPLIQYGDSVDIHIDGRKDKKKGVVSWVSQKAEFTPKNILTPETRTTLVYAVKINVKNDDFILKQGMPVVIKFH